MHSTTAVIRRTILRPFVGCALVVASSTVAGAQSSAVVEPKPFTEMSASVLTMRDSIVALARGQVGTRYLSGGQSPDRGFDCSGLVRYVMSALQFTLPRTAKQQASVGRSVARDVKHLKPGDLLTFGRTKTGISHVGIYVGDGRYVHASSVAGRVIESDVERPGVTLVRAWRGVRRLLSS